MLCQIQYISNLQWLSFKKNFLLFIDITMLFLFVWSELKKCISKEDQYWKKKLSNVYIVYHHCFKNVIGRCFCAKYNPFLTWGQLVDLSVVNKQPKNQREETIDICDSCGLLRGDRAPTRRYSPYKKHPVQSWRFWKATCALHVSLLWYIPSSKLDLSSWRTMGSLRLSTTETKTERRQQTMFCFSD